LLYRSGRVRFGSGLRCDGIPRILVDPGATVVFGDGVELRADVEIRAHGTSRIEIYDHVRIDRGVRLLATNESRISIGKGARVGMYTVFNGGDSISIGDGCLISGFVYLQTSMHRFQSTHAMVKDQGYDHAPIELGRNAWLAAHVVVMPGRRIGQDAIVGSNAVVTRDVEAGHIVAGIPAKTIRDRNDAGA
jgi:acetyltransferase-like isoleucine patch superfamily enzyme